MEHPLCALIVDLRSASCRHYTKSIAHYLCKPLKPEEFVHIG